MIYFDTLYLMAYAPFIPIPQFSPYILGGITTASLDFSMHTCAVSCAALALQLPVSVQQMVVPVQVHGTTIQHVNRNTETLTADGVYTFYPNILLGVAAADCAGILIYDSSTHLLAAIHSGWRGTACGIVPKFISERIACNELHPQYCTAWISPCAHMCCYQVSEEVASQFSNYPSCYIKTHDNYYLDLAKIIKMQLQNNGVPDHHIHTDNACTICDNRFHSHRRDAGLAGRALVFISRTTQAATYYKSIDSFSASSVSSAD